MRQVSTFPHDELPALFPGKIEPIYTRDELAARTDWDAETIRLLAYARKKMWRHGAAAAGYEMQPSDLVKEAIASWLDRRRTFDAGTESGLFAFFCGVIDSLLCHDKEKNLRRGKRCSISNEGGEGLA